MITPEHVYKSVRVNSTNIINFNMATYIKNTKIVREKKEIIKKPIVKETVREIKEEIKKPIVKEFVKHEKITDYSKFSGAGILITECYFKQGSTIGIPSVILALDYTNTYSDFGGVIDNKPATKDEVYKTAAKELLEESRGIINITDLNIFDKAHYIIKQHTSENDVYITFIIGINKISRGLFHDIEKMKTLSYAEKEVTDIIHVPISNLYDIRQNGNKYYVIDIEGKQREIRGRLRGIINADRENKYIKQIAERSCNESKKSIYKVQRLGYNKSQGKIKIDMANVYL